MGACGGSRSVGGECSVSFVQVAGVHNCDNCVILVVRAVGSTCWLQRVLRFLDGASSSSGEGQEQVVVVGEPMACA